MAGAKKADLATKTRVRKNQSNWDTSPPPNAQRLVGNFGGERPLTKGFYAGRQQFGDCFLTPMPPLNRSLFHRQWAS